MPSRVKLQPGKHLAIVRKARLVWTPFEPMQMAEVGLTAVESILKRLDVAQDVWDRPAPPLSPMYARIKTRGIFATFRKPIRDWRRTGHTWSSLKVLRANNNRVVIGFVSDLAKQRVAWNQARHWQWGLSNKNYVRVIDKMVTYLPGRTQIKLVE